VARELQSQFEVMPDSTGFFPDPDTPFYRYFNSKEKTNHMRYNNPEYDKLIEEGRRTIDPTKRKEIYRKALDVLNKDLPCIFIGHYPIAQASRTYLKNMKTNLRGDNVWAYGGVSYAWIEK
jgi:ABC-type transport system substrate-binding protein